MTGDRVDLVSGRSAIAGIGQTVYAKNLGRSELDLACEAIVAACDDAGFPVPEIDGIASYHVEQVSEEALVHALGIDNLSFMARTTNGQTFVFIVANSISNQLVFTSEDYSGTVLTNNENNRVIAVTLQFFQLQYPTIRIGPGSIYDFYQLRTKITRRTVASP